MAGDDERVQAIEKCLADEGQSIAYDNRFHQMGWIAMAFPTGHPGGPIVSPPMGVGRTQREAAESLLADWQKRKRPER